MHLQELGFLAQATEKKSDFEGTFPILAYSMIPMPNSIPGGLKRKFSEGNHSLSSGV